jgi:AraC family transcriptional regulator of adaptative response / DNA-3-methyladenine glycosylase II
VDEQRALTNASILRLAYTPPYDWTAIRSFLRTRAIPGVEHVEGDAYRRTIAIDGVPGTLEVRPSELDAALTLDVRMPAHDRPFIVERVRRLFDLDVDPGIVHAHLGADPLLADVLSRHQGLRTPGAWDGFELAVRAILGQQISVAAASTIAGRIAATCGTRVSGPVGLDRLFPTPDELAHAPLERVGVIGARADTIRQLAADVASGAIVFDTHTDPATTLASLRSIRGIGDWTAQYIAMRALGHRDAFPSGDLVLRRAASARSARELDLRSQPWRPWRAYAVIAIWLSATEARSVSAAPAPSIRAAGG